MVSITHKGLRLLDRTAATVRAKLQNRKWDGKWRMVTFDIPEEFKEQRDRVREILKRAGFVKLQQSVWIFPHDCEELTKLIKEETHLANHILYGVLEKIEHDESLCKVFSLSANRA
jgi:DNA-binding transcriptional regulator PaaX